MIEAVFFVGHLVRCCWKWFIVVHGSSAMSLGQESPKILAVTTGGLPCDYYIAKLHRSLAVSFISYLILVMPDSVDILKYVLPYSFVSW